MNWTGKRIRTKIEDFNDVSNLHDDECPGGGCQGCVDETVRIPPGWLGTVREVSHRDDEEQQVYYSVLWDDDPAHPGGHGNMGWCI